MKRILILIKGLGRGGAEQLLVSAIRYSDPSRFMYDVAYLLPHKNDLVPELEGLGAAVRCLEGARGVGWLGRLRKLIDERAIDLVHVHSPYPAIGARLGLPWHGPLVYTEHNMWPRYHLATFWGNALTFPRNDYVFAVSEGVRTSVRYPRALGWMRMPPVETLYHGPDPTTLVSLGSGEGVRDELGIPADAPIIGTVAHFKTHKGHRHLLKAAVQIRRSLPDARFVLVGRGPLEGSLRRQARDLGLDGSVVFTGYRDDAPRVATAFDIFVLPSEYEGLPIALIEAMALGRPPVVTRTGGNTEVVEDGKNGLVVPPGDAGALADVVVTLLRDRPLRERLGEEARLRAAVFDIRKAVRRTEEVYGGAASMSRASALALDVRPYRPDDELRVLELLVAALGGGPTGERSPDFFRWKHFANPFGPSVMLVAEAEGQIIGFRSLMRWRFRAGEGTVAAVRPVDTATHPKYQGRGVFSRLTRAALDSIREEVDLVFNTPNEKSLPGYLKMGWHVVGDIPVWVRLRKPIRFARGMRSRGESLEASGSRPPIQAKTAAEALGESAEVGSLLERTEVGGSRLRTPRDQAYLHWRYAEAPTLDYRAVREYREGRLCGLAFFRVRSRGRLWESTVTEVIVEPNDARIFHRLLRRAARAAPVDHLTFHFSPDTARVALRSGFLRSPEGMTFVVNPVRESIDPDPSALRSWALSLGDLEVF